VCLAQAGVNGITPRPRGTYRDVGEYKELDIVALNGCSFIAKRDDPGACPGDGWQALTLPGKRGDRGEKGERGLQGERGERGEAGASLIGFKISDDGYAIKALNSDGEEVGFDMRVLFERYHRESNDG